jgi:pimeloyl-ACP methyl ester carboxylesterase
MSVIPESTIRRSEGPEAGAFPVGYLELHPDFAVNFQLNRWIGYLRYRGIDALPEIETVLPRLTDFAAYKREFLALADRALSDGGALRAAYYLRSAEFFMRFGDPDKTPTRRRFIALMWQALGLSAEDRHLIPYRDGQRSGCLPAYRCSTASDTKGTVVLFGGSDSYIEEFLPVAPYFTDAGYDVVMFEGPGQGGALEEYQLPATPDWHKPVSAVLDYFALDDVTLIGVSWGGCHVLRAAAFEPRVSRAIAWDVLYSTHDIWLAKLPAALRTVARALLTLRAARLFNALMYRAMERSMGLDWGVRQGMHLLLVESPYEHRRLSRAFTTADISDKVIQDALILAGTEDWGVPLNQFRQQIAALTNARSVTARLFTRAEQGHQHCQVGNLGLVLDFMLNWINFHTALPTTPGTQRADHPPRCEATTAETASRGPAPLGGDGAQRRAQTDFGTLPVQVRIRQSKRWPPSSVGANISGQPPSITRSPSARPSSAASAETLPAPKLRCIHTSRMPSFAHSRTVSPAASGRVAITTASTPPGTPARFGKQRTPSISWALGLTGTTS